MRSSQATAVKKAVATWAASPSDTELGFPVCKSGYRPFDLVTGERLYGCVRHHKVRLGRIEANNGYMRPGWIPFDQWPAPSNLSTLDALTDDCCEQAS